MLKTFPDNLLLFMQYVILAVLKCVVLFFLDFRRRFIALLSYQFREFTASLGLGVLQNKFTKESDFSGT